MTFLGLAGILIGLLGGRFAVIHRTRFRTGVFLLAYVAHLGAMTGYYFFTLGNITDAYGYYHTEEYFLEQGFGLGTQFVFYIVQTGIKLVGGTYLDYFLLFQVFGFYGICLMSRIFEEIYTELGVDQPIHVYAILFMPGPHFWTACIGKDSPLFLGSCLAIWSAMNVRKRYLAMTCAVGIIVLFRPHIAALAGASVAVMLFFGRGMSWRARVPLIFAALGGLAVSATAIQSTFAVDVTNADSVGDFLARQGEIGQMAEVYGNTAVEGSYLFKLVSLLFRPLFVDANGALALVASAENAVFLCIFLSILLRARLLFRMVFDVAFVRFCFVFAIFVAATLAMIYYNVGLGLRQRTMFLPEVFVIFVALQAFRHARSTHSAEDSAHLLLPSNRGTGRAGSS